MPVAHDGDAIGNLLELIHAVGDIHDTDSPRLERADEGKQLLNLGIRQRSGGFVHNHNARARKRQRLGNLHHLLFGDGEALDGRGCIEL
ncbi:hypothetical protein SDC9_182836 [bioreactor metagenome]|uniref:Uncharacterized protein n=1 Tax=bioreactor metagenome TaxID=1076179 RepID=A0A645H8N8_9ZZZZ